MSPEKSWRLLALAGVCTLWLGLAGCGGGGSGSHANEEPPTPVSSISRLSGKVTYDSVPATQDGLDYAAVKKLPVRGAIVQAFDTTGAVLASTSTDGDGAYQLELKTGAKVRVRVQARLLKDRVWDVAVRDNTASAFAQKFDSSPIYALTSSTQNIDGRDDILNLHAASGWRDGKYADARSAAPFSILDQAYTAMQRFRMEIPDLQFPPLNIYWSKNNKPSEGGDISRGDIETSHWNPEHEGLFILGKENVDTDEFDTAIIVHEWGHYFESKLSRSDSIGGGHGFSEDSPDLLDMRVAWGEGWGNGLAGVVRRDPTYIDTLGAAQKSLGVVMNVAQLPKSIDDRSWYSESSLQYFIYQMAQTPGGWAATVRTMLNEQRVTPAYTSIFTFAAGLKNHLPDSSFAAVNSLLDSINTPRLEAIDSWANSASYQTPTRNGQQPVYISLNANPVEVCASNSYSSPNDSNKLDQYRFLRLVIAETGKYRIDMQPSGVPLPGSEPGIIFPDTADNDDDDNEDVVLSIVRDFEKGVHRMAFSDRLILEGDARKKYNSCYQIQVNKE